MTQEETGTWGSGVCGVFVLSLVKVHLTDTTVVLLGGIAQL